MPLFLFLSNGNSYSASHKGVLWGRSCPLLGDLPVNYQSSIRAITVAEAHYFVLCDLAETDDAIAEALERLWRIKAEHKAEYGTLTRIEGAWI